LNSPIAALLGVVCAGTLLPANAQVFAVPRSYVDGPDGNHFFGVSNDLVGCGHMSGLFLRSIYPLALMKSDGRDPYQQCELSARER